MLGNQKIVSCHICDQDAIARHLWVTSYAFLDKDELMVTAVGVTLEAPLCIGDVGITLANYKSLSARELHAFDDRM